MPLPNFLEQEPTEYKINIDAAINDHDSRITQNETDVADHESRIAQNETDIAAVEGHVNGYHMYAVAVDKDANAIHLPSGWSVTNNGFGFYYIYPPFSIDSTNTVATATPLADNMTVRTSVWDAEDAIAVRIKEAVDQTDPDTHVGFSLHVMTTAQ